MTMPIYIKDLPLEIQREYLQALGRVDPDLRLNVAGSVNDDVFTAAARLGIIMLSQFKGDQAYAEKVNFNIQQAATAVHGSRTGGVGLRPSTKCTGGGLNEK